MALSPQVLYKTIDLIKSLKKDFPDQVLKVGSLGYPDILVSIQELEDQGITGLTPRPDSDYICSYHGKEQFDVPDAISFFKALGAELFVLDIKKWRGGEIVVDLNYPVDEKLKDNYHLLINNGSAEHCANICQVFFNDMTMVMPGGYILDWGPHNFSNHGLWSLNPTTFYDFYTQNGLEFIECILWNKEEGGKEVAYQVHPTKRFNFPSWNNSLLAVARKPLNFNETHNGYKFPTQSKYLKLGINN